MNSSNIYSDKNILKRNQNSKMSEEDLIQENKIIEDRAKLKRLFHILKLKTKDPKKIHEAIDILNSNTSSFI